MLTRNSEATESPISAADLVLIAYIAGLARQVADKLGMLAEFAGDEDQKVTVSALALYRITEELRVASEDGFDLFKKLAQDVMPSYQSSMDLLGTAE